MNALDTKVPPPVVTLLIAAAMKGAAALSPTLGVPGPARTGAALLIVVAGLLIELAGAATLVRARTTVDPIHPSHASGLVTGGVYRFTRNPIYLGDLMLLLGWAVYLGSPVALLGAPALVLYLHRFQIRPEERALSDLFGAAFDEYRERVRRWL